MLRRALWLLRMLHRFTTNKKQTVIVAVFDCFLRAPNER